MEEKSVICEVLVSHIVSQLDAYQAEDIKYFRMEQIDIAQYIVIASGRSARHLSSIMENLLLHVRHCGYSAEIGIEGHYSGTEWILLDFAGITVHLMKQTTRTYYGLEDMLMTKGTQINACV